MISPYVYVGLVSKDSKVYNEKKLMGSLVTITAKIFEIKESEVMSSKRTRLYVQARTVIAHILRHKYKLPFKSIGLAMGKDHSTVIHMINNHNHDIEWCEAYKKRCTQIERLHTC